MPKIVYVHVGLFNSESRLAALSWTAAQHDVVLITDHQLMMGGGRLAVLHQALAPRRLVALLIADDLRAVERTFVDELLNDGIIPLLVHLKGGPAAALMSWLEKDERSTGGSGPQYTSPRSSAG